MQRGTQPRQFEKLFEGKKKSHGYLKGMLWDKIDEDKKSGEYKLSHHVDLKSGYYNGKKILDI